MPPNLGFNNYGVNFNPINSNRIDLGLNTAAALDLTGFNVFTIEAMINSRVANDGVWRNVLHLGNYEVILRKTATGFLQIFFSDGVERSTLQDVLLTTDTPIHVAGVYTGTELSLWINCVKQSTPLAIASNVRNNPQRDYVGTEAALTNFWDGLIYWVRVYRGSYLNESQLLYNMLNYHNPIRTNLVLWLTLEEGSGLTTQDISGYGFNGAFQPAATPPTWVKTEKWALRAKVGL